LRIAELSASADMSRITDLFRRISSSADRPVVNQGREAAKPAAEDVKAAGLVDFREVANKYTFQQHAERADAYFSGLDLDSPVARKPFATPFEAVELSAGVAAILSKLFLFRGAQVLDFGAGGCWLSRILALLGCQVTATDISANALQFGRGLMDKDPLSQQLQIAYVPLRENRLPFDDASFDRIVCFDALHHCSDQKNVIREFYRVLRGGGVAAFHEPGPRHSTQAQSQQEMRNFDVVEGDIVIEDLAQEAHLAGFSKLELAVFVANPAMVSLDDFNHFMDAPEESESGRELLTAARRENENRRVFFLHKGDVLASIDSRSPVGLLARFEVEAAYSASGVSIQGTVTNIGAARWLPSDQGPGSVNIGVHLYDDSGKLVNHEFARRTLSREPVGHGQPVAIEFSLPFPDALDRYCLIVDLVAEGITWFETGCSVPVKIRVDRVANCAQIRR
jgi:2-polyprenyl-3-methyl-5-hydroxy-6-metoxy-1,4-benzoquinol methylase